MSQETSFDRRIIELILDIDQHIDGYIDAYIGPAELKEAAVARAKVPPTKLLEDVTRLMENIPNDDAARQAYLVASLRAVETTIRMLAGEEIPYMEQVQRIYDIMPQRVDEDIFLQAQNELDIYLPGAGRLADRFQDWRNQYNTPAEKLLPALQDLAEEAKKRTKLLVDLPAHETIKIELVSDQPWGAYNWYKGNGRSLIEFNTDIPKSAFGLLSTMTHEGYPGHHTESVVKEQNLWIEHGYGEAAAMLLHSPAAVIAEGIAMTAVEIIFPGREELHWTLEHLLPSIPLPVHETADQIWHIQEALQQLRWVTGNAAILFHTRQLSGEQIIEYLQTYGLAPANRAQKSLDFITHPLYGSYPFTYTEGYDLISKAAGSDNKRDVFLDCLTGQVLPSQLMAEAAKQAQDKNASLD